MINDLMINTLFSALNHSDTCCLLHFHSTLLSIQAILGPKSLFVRYRQRAIAYSIRSMFVSVTWLTYVTIEISINRGLKILNSLTSLF